MKSPNILFICLLSNPQSALNKVVAATFLFLSIFTPIKLLASVSNSSQAPRLGIILAPKHFLPLNVWLLKKAPGERISWAIATLSIPLTTKVPLSVIKGKSVKKTSCSLLFLVLRLTNFALTLKDASKESLFSFASKSVLYFGLSNL